MTRRKPKAAPEFRNRMRRWALDVALQRYYERWLRARERVVEKCIADVLGHAREHDAAELAAQVAYAGINRSTSSRLLGVSNSEPFSIDTLRSAALKIIAMVPQPPTRPWLFRHRFEQLVREGIPAELIKRHFDIT